MSHLPQGPQLTYKSRNHLPCVSQTLERAGWGPGKGKNVQSKGFKGVSLLKKKSSIFKESRILTMKAYFCTSLRPHDPSTLEQQIQWYTETSGYPQHPCPPPPTLTLLKDTGHSNSLFPKWKLFPSSLLNPEERISLALFFLAKARQEELNFKIRNQHIDPSFCLNHRPHYHLNKMSH